MVKIKSKIDGDTMYEVYSRSCGHYIKITRNDETMAIKMSRVSEYEGVFIPKIYKELCEIQEEHSSRVCPVCGKQFVAFTKRKYCSDECSKKAQMEKARAISQSNTNQKNKKHVSQLTELNREARAKGMSYGQLQAQRYMEQMRGVEVG